MLINFSIKHHHVRTLTTVIILNEVGIIIVVSENLLATQFQLVPVELLLCLHLIRLIVLLEAWLQEMRDGQMVIIHVAPGLKWSIIEEQYVAAGPGLAIRFVVCVRQNILVVSCSQKQTSHRERFQAIVQSLLP